MPFERFFMIDRLLKIQENMYHLYFFKNEDIKDDIVRKRDELQILSKIKGINEISTIVYNSTVDDCFYVTEYELHDHITHHKAKPYSIEEYSKKFRKENDSVKRVQSSKKFGDKKKNDKDVFIIQILKEITHDETFESDDEGVGLTERLLGNDSTAGFDIDLYDRKNNIVYEFLKTETKEINNAKAHPMRYCWVKNKKDDARKFISLDEFSKTIKAQLIFVIYSMDSTRQDSNYVKLIMNSKIDPIHGFQEDYEYLLTLDEFKDFLIADASKMQKFLSRNRRKIHLKEADFDLRKEWKNRLGDFDKEWTSRLRQLKE